MSFCITNYKFVITFENKMQKVLPLQRVQQLDLPPGARLSIVEVGTGKPATQVLAKRQGRKLVLGVEGEGDISEITDFYDNAAQFSAEIPLTESSQQAIASENLGGVSPGCEPVVTSNITPPALLGSLAFGGAVAKVLESNTAGTTPVPCTEVFTITETTAATPKQRLSMKVGDRFEVVRDENYVITGYLFNGKIASDDLVQAFLGVQAVLEPDFYSMLQKVSKYTDDNGTVTYGYWNFDENGNNTDFVALDEIFMSHYYNTYDYQYGFSDQLTSEYFGESPFGYYFDALEIRENGTYLIGSPNRMAYLKLQSGVPLVDNEVAIQLQPEICGAFFVDAAAARVHFSAASGAPVAFTKLEAITVITDKFSLAEFSNNGGANFMQALRTIHVEATGQEGLLAQVDISGNTNDKTNETVIGFLSSLESITVIGSVNAAADLDITASGGDYFMSALKTIQVKSTGEDKNALLSIKASANGYQDADGNSVNFTNDHFMQSLESIQVISANAAATFSVSHSGGSHFMESLKTIALEAGYSAKIQISASVNYAGATGDYFMTALQSITLQTQGREAFNRNDRLSLSISNGGVGEKTTGGDFFMTALTAVRLAGGINSDAVLEIDNHAGNDFMTSLERIEVIASANGNAVVDVRNLAHTVETFNENGDVSGTETFVGERFMNALTTVHVEGLNAYVRLAGLIGTTIPTLTFDLSAVGGATKSLGVVLTNDADFSIGATTTLVTKIGSSNLQVNAVYEIKNEFTMDELIWNGTEYVSNPNYVPQEDREQLLQLFSNTTAEQVNTGHDRTSSMTLDPYNDTYTGNLRTIDGRSDFIGFAGVNISESYGESDYPGGWVDLGGNGVKDIFQFTTSNMGNVVMGGFEDGKDIFDFSLIANSFNGTVNDQSDVPSLHVATQTGGILVTQADDSADVRIWLNTEGNETASFEDFESWFYVVNGAGMTWTTSDFNFTVI